MLNISSDDWENASHVYTEESEVLKVGSQRESQCEKSFTSHAIYSCNVPLDALHGLLQERIGKAQQAFSKAQRIGCFLPVMMHMLFSKYILISS